MMLNHHHHPPPPFLLLNFPTNFTSWPQFTYSNRLYTLFDVNYNNSNVLHRNIENPEVNIHITTKEIKQIATYHQLPKF
ncbi:hypothetical protein QVD17_05975 [Tagetes erecta]|uniref:Uncharacterized protein n=1 Tax=Tagetes erecta TaxID=13708 RepID=A0AAD8LCY6_TARER|nr:hypothetical protein QVD17_05975 [Tagetes erecta]